MIGLVLPVLILFLIFYIWLSVKVVRSAVKHSKEVGGNHVLAGWVVGIIMYSLILWDFIPTHAMHQYYCAQMVASLFTNLWSNGRRKILVWPRP